MNPFIIVIFGATGDLARHKLFPALYSLYKKKQLGDSLYIVGFARRVFSDAEYGHWLGDELETHHDSEWNDFAKHIYYQQGFFDDRTGYEQLITKFSEFEKKIDGDLMRLFYLATPPDNYS